LVAQDAAIGIGELAVGASTNAEVVTELPVIQIVSAALAGLGESGNFIAFKAVLGQQGKPGLFGVGHLVAVGLFRWVVIKGSVRLDGQLIPAQVGRPQRHGLLQVRQRFRPTLPRQTVHQIQIEIIKAGAASRFSGMNRFILAMNAT